MRKIFSKTLTLVDLFCGAGGTSTGASRAAQLCGFIPRITAINHSPIAIRTHTVNHPDAEHKCTGIDSIDPRKLFKPGQVNGLLASPECTNHSNARGGKPINDQSRATAHCVVRWAEALLPDFVIVENVKEFMKWGPLDSKGRPIKRREGELFHAWLNMFKACGYRVDFRVICFADYGDPTTRERLIIQCVRGRRKIVWPEPTHGPSDSSDLFGSRRPYATARECIDWNLHGQSIFTRKKPLVVKSIRRILAGFERFAMDPFLVPSKTGKNRVRSVNRPLHTVTCESRGEALIQPFLVEHRGTSDRAISNSARSVHEPASPICTSGAHHGLSTAFVMPHPRVNESPARHVDQPMPTVTATSSDFSLASTFLVQTAHGESEAERGKGHNRRVRPIDQPMATVCGERGDWAVISSALLGQQSEAAASHVDKPAPTVATGGAIGKIDYLVSMDNQSAADTSAVRGVDEPLSTVVTKARHCLLSSFLVSYYGTNCASSTESAVPTVTTKERFGLIRPSLELVEAPNGVFRRVTYWAWKRLILAQARKGKLMSRLYVQQGDSIHMVEITHRMLQDNELALAQGFPKSYEFCGTKTQKVKQIGNAVPPNGACAIVAACLTQNSNVTWLWDAPRKDQSVHLSN